MTNLSYEQLEAEFMRQIRLCSGLGKWRMIELVFTSEHTSVFPESPEEIERVRRMVATDNPSSIDPPGVMDEGVGDG